MTASSTTVTTPVLNDGDDGDCRMEKGRRRGEKDFSFSKTKGLILESENRSFYEGKKMISSCLKKKTKGYSLVVQYSAVEEKRRWGV